jgi:hydroxyacylglutathione hydrolase
MILRAAVGPLACNAKLIVCPETGQAVFLDPGDEPETLLGLLKNAEDQLQKPVTPLFFLHTHAHFDHVGATASLKKIYQAAKVCLHPKDELLYAQLPMQGQLFGFRVQEGPTIEHWLEDEEIIRFGGLTLHLMHTPGHSPGSVCFRLPEQKAYACRETLFTGDTLFQGSVGRTDLWLSDGPTLQRSLKRILELDDETLLEPGHGPSSVLGLERRTNPFLLSRLN